MFEYYLGLSWKSIKRTPMLTLLMILAIGLGISVSITVLTVDYLMSQDPIPNKSHQLFHVQLDTYNAGNTERSPDGLPIQLSYQDVTNLKASDIPVGQTRMVRTGFSVTSGKPGESPTMEAARAADSDFFDMFDVPFLYGGPWNEKIDLKPQKVVVISKDMNDHLFDGKDSIGKLVTLDKHQFRVTGVIDSWELTPRFYDVNNGGFADTEEFYFPFSLVPIIEVASWGNNTGFKNEKINTYQDKLRSEAMWNQFWVQLDTQSQQLNYRQFLNGYIEQQRALGRFEKPDARSDIKNVIQWMDYNRIVSDDNSVLVGLSFMFLAVCMINTIGLLLAKFMRRAPEVGVRRALGASRFNIFTQHLVDTAIIGLGGGVFGLLLAQLGLYGVKQLYGNYERLVHMDLTLVLTGIGIAIAASLIAGLYPAWLICRTSPSIYLKLQ